MYGFAMIYYQSGITSKEQTFSQFTFHINILQKVLEPEGDAKKLYYKILLDICQIFYVEQMGGKNDSILYTTLNRPISNTERMWIFQKKLHRDILDWRDFS